MLSRVLYGARISLSIGLISVFLSLALGVVLGGVSGNYGGWVDNLIQRIIEFLRSIPSLPLWMALNPQMIICDEPVSALDVSIQAQILNLLKDLRTQFQLTYLFISHDLNVVRYLSDRVAVMYIGKIVEIADTQELFNNIQHPYTEALLSSAPTPDPRAKRKRTLPKGEVADPANPPSGCYFHPRCQYARDRCKIETPLLRETKPGHWAACHFSEALKLGV